MVSVRMKSILLCATMMVETAVLIFTKNIASNALATLKNFVWLDLHLLQMVMDSAMMKRIMLHVNMMVGTAVEIPTPNIAQTALVFFVRLALLDFLLLQLEMVFAMMKTTMLIVDLMDSIAADLPLIHYFVLNANAMVRKNLINLKKCLKLVEKFLFYIQKPNYKYPPKICRYSFNVPIKKSKKLNKSNFVISSRAKVVVLFSFFWTLKFESYF